MGISRWLSYTPQVYEATNVTVQKNQQLLGAVNCAEPPLAAKTYRLYGTGLAASVLNDHGPVGRGGTVQVGNLAAGTYNWILRAEYDPGIRSNGVPVSVTLP